MIIVDNLRMQNMTLIYDLKKDKKLYFIISSVLAILLLTACGKELTPTTTPETNLTNIATTIPSTEAKNSDGYPDSIGYPNSSGYPIPNIYENLSNEPPSPDVNLPSAIDGNAVIGGVLVREVVEEGFEPLVPLSLALANIVLSTDGKPAFISAGEESSKAELFPTGIFIFQNVPPGTYGFMVDVGYTEFFIKDNEDTPMLVDVQAGDVIDLGQIFTELP